jgi:RHS repeat-associated protein
MELILQPPEFVTATFYVRDASGNVMAVYKTSGTTNLTLEEQHIYGSSRLGIFKKDKTIKNKARALGERRYELTDHLGNVRVVMSDYKRTAVIVLSATDYYPFGMVARTYTSPVEYRYGFNGQEKDDEIKGSGNHYSFGDYGYDPRIGRRWNIDPKSTKYPWQSPYSAFNLNPIIYNDPNGKDGVLTISGNTITVHSRIYIYGSGATQATANQMQSDIMNKWGDNNGQPWTYTDPSNGKVYNVQFDISVQLYHGKAQSNPSFIPESWNPDNRDNFIEVGASLKDVARSYVKGGDEGVWRGVGRNGLTLAQDDPAPHEVGHLLGLDDRYDDKTGAHPGWGTNIMGDSKNGVVEQRNINSIVEDGVKRFNVVLQELGDINKNGKGKLSDDTMHYDVTGTFKYDIDIDTPNK